MSQDGKRHTLLILLLSCDACRVFCHQDLHYLSGNSPAPRLHHLRTVGEVVLRERRCEEATATRFG